MKKQNVSNLTIKNLTEKFLYKRELLQLKKKEKILIAFFTFKIWEVEIVKKKF